MAVNTVVSTAYRIELRASCQVADKEALSVFLEEESDVLPGNVTGPFGGGHGPTLPPTGGPGGGGVVPPPPPPPG